ncbi:MAG TPA: dihydroneopterin aldolase family protein [Thermoplasmata archaeon]|nr:dihydroneopterin aldolase family protein [Thermoplasmata archaeon]
MPTRRAPAPRLSRREALLFEAGIKLGGVFHQYLGIPVDRSTAPALARAIEDAVGLQPFVRSVSVRIDPTRGGPVGRGRFAYRYLTPEMLRVRVRVADGGEEVDAVLAHRPDLRYPLMAVARVGRRRGARRPGARAAARSGRTAGRARRRTSRSAG